MFLHRPKQWPCHGSMLQQRRRLCAMTAKLPQHITVHFCLSNLACSSLQHRQSACVSSSHEMLLQLQVALEERRLLHCCSASKPHGQESNQAPRDAGNCPACV